MDDIWLARFTIEVDAGRQQFVAVAQKKAASRVANHPRRAAWVAAAKASGRCCGVFCKPELFGRAVCRKCGSSVRIQI